MRTVYVIEEPGATWVFFDVRAWTTGILSEVHRRGFDGPGELLAYSGEIPDAHATATERGMPDEACVDYVMANVEPKLAED